MERNNRLDLIHYATQGRDLTNIQQHDPLFALVGRRNGVYFVSIHDWEGDVELPVTVKDYPTAQACFDYLSRKYPGLRTVVDIDPRADQQQMALVKPFHNPLPEPARNQGRPSKIRNLLGMMIQNAEQADPMDLQLAHGLNTGRLTFDDTGKVVAQLKDK